MIKTVFSIEEVGLIEQCLMIVENSIDRGDIHDLTSEGDELLEYHSQGYFDGLKEFCKKVESKK